MDRLTEPNRSHLGHGSNAGHSSGVAGVDAQKATPPDPRLATWGLAGCRQLDPSHPPSWRIGPPSPEGLLLVEAAGVILLDGEQSDVVRPRQREPSRQV